MENPVDRVITRTDNNPPEAVEMLPPAKELPKIFEEDIKSLKKDALAELDTYSRIPAKIESDEVYQKITTLAMQIKGVADRSDNTRTAHKRPYLDATKVLDTAFKLEIEAEGKTRNIRKELDEAYAKLKKMLSDRDTELYLEQEKAAEEERKRIIEAAAADGIEISDEELDAAKMESVKSSYGGQSVRRVVDDWEVVDEELLPRSVLSVDPEKVKKLLENGAKSIPGIKIGKRVSTHVKKG